MKAYLDRWVFYAPEPYNCWMAHSQQVAIEDEWPDFECWTFPPRGRTMADQDAPAIVLMRNAPASHARTLEVLDGDFTDGYAGQQQFLASLDRQFSAREKQAIAGRGIDDTRTVRAALSTARAIR